MAVIKALVSFILCLANLLYVSSTCYQLILFLSQLRKDVFRENMSDIILPSLLTDGWILILFIAQHSFMKLPPVNALIKKLQLEVWQRTIYVVATCFVLQMLMKYWTEIGTYKLWEFRTTDLCWWIFTVVHATCWVVIYGGCLLMDLLEIIGVKQVYYSVRGYQSPICYKSVDLLRLCSHYRHPSVLAFLVILWFYPVMGLGRLLLATVLSLYLILAFKADPIDYSYQKVQIQQKKIELQYTFAN